MIYRIFADLVGLIHFGFVLFVVFGGLLALRWRWVPYVHLPAALWGVLIEFADWICPLTPLENWLRRRGGAEGYSGGFVEHYVLPLIYPGELTRKMQIVLGALVIVVNAVVYAIVMNRKT